MRVLLNEINCTQCGFEYDLGSFGLFDNVMSFSKIDKSSQIYEIIKDIEKKMNWLKYNGKSICRTQFFYFGNSLEYISILNECLKIDDNHIILLCFRSNFGVSDFKIINECLDLDIESCVVIDERLKEYKYNYKSGFKDIKEKFKMEYFSTLVSGLDDEEYSIENVDENEEWYWGGNNKKDKSERVFERYFDEKKFNDDFF